MMTVKEFATARATDNFTIYVTDTTDGEKYVYYYLDDLVTAFVGYDVVTVDVNIKKQEARLLVERPAESYAKENVLKNLYDCREFYVKAYITYKDYRDILSRERLDAIRDTLRFVYGKTRDELDPILNRWGTNAMIAREKEGIPRPIQP